MITIIYSTHKDKEYNDKFNDHLILTSGLQWVQVLPYENHNEYSLSEIYNKGIEEAKYDIVVCCHKSISLDMTQTEFQTEMGRLEVLGELLIKSD